MIIRGAQAGLSRIVGLSTLSRLGRSRNPAVRQRAFEKIAEKLGPNFTLKPCNLDGAAPSEQVILDHKQFIGLDLFMAQCRRCGLIFFNPQPGPEILSRMYTEDYFMGGDVAGKWAKVGYRDYWGSESEYRTQAARDNLDLISRFRSGTGDLLDVGCASGFFLDIAGKAGWRVKGVEFSEAAVKIAQERFGLNVFHGTLEASPLAAESFDLITSFDVIEHVPDPMAHVARIRQLLRPGGLLVLDTPNIKSQVAQVQKNEFWLIKADHLFYFSPETIRKVLEATGLKVVEMSKRILSQYDPAPELFPGTEEGSHLTVIAQK